MSDEHEMDAVGHRLVELDPADADYAIRFVDTLLGASRQVMASDVHLQPTSDGLAIHWRLDGVLQRLGIYRPGDSADVITRLKVLANLLTYRTDFPQEGRIDNNSREVEMRVSTFPTLHGERAVVRLFSADGQHLHLNELGFPEDVVERLFQLLSETSGAIIITGPAGSGKTTTNYACLRHLVQSSQGGRSIVSLEDPVEVAVDGVSQSQVNSAAGLTLATGLRSLLRQDPEVIMVGEMRDRETAEVAFQASLTGQLVLTTFHSGSAAGAISRLSDIGIEPYLLRSGVLGIVGQRLVRRLCECARVSNNEADRLGLDVTRTRLAVGCSKCKQTGYSGRVAIVELLLPGTGDLARAILSRGDASELEELAVQAGMTTRWRRAKEAIEGGLTSAAEVRRVFGFSGS